MFRRSLGAVMPALLIVLVAVAPSAAASGGPDPWYCDQHTCPTDPMKTTSTCHFDTGCTSSVEDVFAFHNDDSIERSVWARNTAGDVDYWQCILPGAYSGDPAHHPSQGSTAGEALFTPPGTMGGWLGDFDTLKSQYAIEWRTGCWAPCDPLNPPPICVAPPFPDRTDTINQG